MADPEQLAGRHAVQVAQVEEQGLLVIEKLDVDPWVSGGIVDQYGMKDRSHDNRTVLSAQGGGLEGVSPELGCRNGRAFAMTLINLGLSYAESPALSIGRKQPRLDRDHCGSATMCAGSEPTSMQSLRHRGSNQPWRLSLC